MIEKDKDLLFIKSVLKTCHILMIDERRLSASLGLREPLSVKGSDSIKLTREEIETFTKLIHIYFFLDTFCGGNIEFIHHWINTENEYFDQVPRECFYSKNGIQKLYDYVQRFN